MNAAVGKVGARRTAVVVIGGGQAGLSCSHYLSRFGVEHVVLERGEVANSWRRERWDSLRLLTPNWQSSLPGKDYQGDAPDGFMGMPEVIGFIDAYARESAAPVEVHTEVTGIRPAPAGYRVCTSRGDWECMAIIVASGAFNRPSVPGLAAQLPGHIRQVDTHGYRNPEQLSRGGVLVVGAGASGVQIAREIQRSGRQVTLAVGEHVRVPRRYRGRDIQYWMQATGLLDEDWQQVDDLQRARRLPSAQLVGCDECGDDISGNVSGNVDLNTLSEEGVQLAGRLAGLCGRKLQFSGGLANVTRLADLKLNRLLDLVDESISQGSVDAGADAQRPDRIQLPVTPCLEKHSNELRTVIWATGYRPDYSWLELPVLDRKGMPRHRGGVGELPGLYFMGLPFMRRRKSSFMCGAGDDARDICHHLLAYLGRPVDWYWQNLSATAATAGP